MRLVIILLLFVVLFQFSFSATIQGEVYEWYSLDKLNNVIVDINTSPKQTDISNDGQYLFEVPLGNYHILAKYYEQGELIYSDEQEVSITREGNFVIDLIMFPALEEIDAQIDDINFGDDFETIDGNLGENLIDAQENTCLLVGVLIIVLVLFGLLFIKSRRQPVGRGNWVATKEAIVEKGKEKKVDESVDKYANQVLNLLKRRGNRLTQKEIRDEIKEIGEAKISLIITELEALGKVKKIKKGRSNIIVLKEK